MEDQFVTYPLALILKELGFNKQCIAYWYKYGKKNPKLLFYDYDEDDMKSKTFTLAPLWQQAYWFLLSKFEEVNGFKATSWKFTTDEEEYFKMIKSCK